MRARQILVAALFVSQFYAPAATAAENSTALCRELRKSISEQLKQARLTGDKARRTTLGENLQALHERCRGVTPLQANHVAIERASRLASEREVQLREALGKGDSHVIELRQRQLDQARQELEAAKR